MAAGLGVAFAALSADASAYVVKKTTRGDFVHWQQDQVVYTVDPSLGNNVEGAVMATHAAMGDWSGTVGAPELDEKALDAESPQKPGFDEKNGIFFMPDGWAPAGRALAITVLTYDNISGRILDADIIFNGAYRFEVLDVPSLKEETLATGATRPSATDGITHVEEDGDLGTVYDLHHVVAHELGHSLGMNDEMDRREALMYRFTAPHDASVRSPVADDIAGLAELYSTRLEGAGNGCGNATVAPKKPAFAASQLAMFATLGLLAFLVLRGRGDRRARFAFLAAAALSAYGLFPRMGEGGAIAQARAATPAEGHARAKVLSVATSTESGLLKTTYRLATTACRAASCPKLGHGSTWGGTMGSITQEVGGYYAPHAGDDVDVSFRALPSALAPLSTPLGAPASSTDAEVRVLTHAE